MGGPRDAGAGREAWLLSERADFWVLSAGGGALLLAMAAVLLWHGEYEIAAADLLLGELHLGATYQAIVQRRLWRRMPLDVLAMPLAIAVAAYALWLADNSLAVTTAILYVGAWHRGRQGLGIARHFQRGAGGPVSPAHRWLLDSAFYLPMIATIAHYGTIAPTDEGEEFWHLWVPPDMLWLLGMAAVASVLAYLGWTVGRTAAPEQMPRHSEGAAGVAVHPCERWLVLAHAVGFGTAYVFGAWTSSLVLVLAIHHEVQYLYFTYAVGRQAGNVDGQGVGPELRRLARFASWPVIGLASWVVCKATGLGALDPFLTAGLLGHYWLDGRIWTSRARRRARSESRT